MPQATTSWGRWPRQQQSVSRLASRFDALPDSAVPMLPYGNGRSYGDVCLNQDGLLVQTRGLDRFIHFDPKTGIVECEAGVLLKEIIDLVLPQGWFPPVTPGTAFVTVGGAIANDVHGKNHHRMASFSRHVICFELHRSDGSRMLCSPTENSQWFEATVGGLGLTGLVTYARLQMRRVNGPWFRGDSQRFANLSEFFALSKASDHDFEYTVAWVDCVASGKQLGRGVFMRGNHAPGEGREPKHTKIRVPFTPPLSLVNGLSLKVLNQLYYWRPSAIHDDAIWHYEPFLYPLDSILEWNRIYGPRGFFQYQCVVPEQGAERSIRKC